MREYVSSVSPKGQIVLPAEIREALGVRPKDRVAIRLEGDRVVVTPLRSGLAARFRSIPALPQKLTDKEITEIAWEDHAMHVAREGLDP